MSNALRARECYRRARHVAPSLNRALQVLLVSQWLIDESREYPLWWPTAKRDDIFRHQHGESEVSCSLDDVLSVFACLGAGEAMQFHDPTVIAVKYYLLAMERRIQDWLRKKAETERASWLW